MSRSRAGGRDTSQGQFDFDPQPEGGGAGTTLPVAQPDGWRAPDVDQARRLVRDWARVGALRGLDTAFVDFVLDRSGTGSGGAGLVAVSVALCSHQYGRGHTCLDLAAVLEEAKAVLDLPPEPLRPEAIGLTWPAGLLAGLDLEAWIAALKVHPAITDAAGLDDRVAAEDEAPDARPLVLDGPRLYLRRSWVAECAIASAMAVRAQTVSTPPGVRAHLDQLFPPAAGATQDNAPAPDWQKLACALALRSRVCVITGGPGTGKTTTVTRLLALLVAEALAGEGGRVPRIRLAAPTGKAAARLRESIGNALAALQLDGLPDPDRIRAALVAEVSTLHRLLGVRGGGGGFVHDARNPLAVDLLVVDEASMIDLELFAAMLAALPGHARLVLLGDRDQLASVEAGAVLGELCRDARDGRYRPDTVAAWEAMTGERVPPAMVDVDGPRFDQSVVMLRFSRRFDAGSAIGRLATAVNAGDVATQEGLWHAGDGQLGRIGLAELLRTAAGEGGYGPCMARIQSPPSQSEALRPGVLDAWAREVLEAFAHFRVLCAIRQGEAGVEGLNEAIIRELREMKRLEAHPAGTLWFAGRPVMVTRNDYELGLMNGDIGITLPRPDAAGRARLWVVFPGAEDGDPPRWVLPGRLSAVETVFAMTVHKSQGSEFDRVALVLPPQANPGLTRELLYTAITRARKAFLLVETAPELPIFEQAVRRQVRRASGLAARLLGPGAAR